MNDAWMVRSGERQRLLEDLRHKAFRLDENTGVDIDHALASVALAWLDNSDLKSGKTFAEEFFFGIVLPSISEFSRANEEKYSLVADFLEMTLKSFSLRFHSAFSRKEFLDPRTIFHAASAMSQI